MVFGKSLAKSLWETPIVDVGLVKKNPHGKHDKKIMLNVEKEGLPNCKVNTISQRSSTTEEGK